MGAAALAAGCGSDGSTSQSSATSATQATLGGPPPSNLVGSYSTKLKQSDLPANPPPELTDGSLDWKLVVAKSGGQNGGPSLSLANGRLGSFESIGLGVQGSKVLLHREVCAAGGIQRLYDNQYAYKRTGSTLRFTAIKNQCSDRVVQTILTSERWKQAGQ